MEAMDNKDMIVIDSVGDESILSPNQAGKEPNLAADESKDDDDSFFLDISGRESGTEENVGFLPRYETVGKVLDAQDSGAEEEEKVNESRPKKSCFNCGGDHNLPDCQEPHNRRLIAENRRKFNANRGPSNQRYHEDDVNKFGHFRPGNVSEALREALGLRHNDLPPFTYRMRTLGYPPGWLKEAEVERAPVKLFDGDGMSVGHPEEEAGEEASTKYRPEKLISFPGFNTKPPNHVRDDWRRMGFFPMRVEHRLEEFQKHMNKNKATTYRKRKMTRTSTADAQKDANVGMEVSAAEESGGIVEWNPPLPSEPAPPLPSSEDGEASSSSGEGGGGGGLTRLQQERERLLQQLQSEDGSESKKEVKVETSDDSNAKSESKTPPASTANGTTGDADDDEGKHNEADNNQSEGDSSKPGLEENTASGRVTPTMGKSKSCVLGASIPDSITEYTSSPGWRKWNVGVSEHIVFDNLPDSTGTWNRMRGLVKKVKLNMEQLHDEDT